MRDFKQAQKLKDHLAVVVGAGRSGLSAARLLLALGARVRLADANPDLPPEVRDRFGPEVEIVTGEHLPEHFRDADIVVLSPGVAVRRLGRALNAVPERKVVAELELASWFVEAPIVAVTGTNGKTTTCTLISRILAEAGKKVFTGGNIGTPLCQYLLEDEPAEVLVLEASSFQLQNCRLFKPNIGLLLNFSANHLDYHRDMDEYLQAKLNLFARQSESDTAILPEELRGLLEAREFTRARKIYFRPTERFACPGLVGEHNRANIEAAWQAVKALGVDQDTAARAVAGFKALTHRLQALGEKRGVLFVDDSKATTPEAMAAAVKSFDRPVRLLAGGVFKGGDLAALIPTLRGRVAEIGLFGGAREVFESALSRDFDLFWEPDLSAAARRLFQNAAAGDVILLSPATASFDQYSSYAERGDDFQRLYRELS
ncbi:MAG: UDP-N-acetylmuramoyl-L-alanine--D-glutamate ligase [Desulfovibrionaceae bacterium]|nr:UDP-N-acetylmuramoyl-L-alanine--D-glutamate ligase [Desulfovibrionaceae bacterium]